MRNIESLSCDVANGMVYVYDQDGNMVDTYSYPDIENAYSTGRGIVIETESMVYTYSLRGDYLKLTGSRFRSGGRKPPPDDLIAKVSNRTEEDCGSYRGSYSSPSSSGSSAGGCGLILVLGCIVGLYNIFFSGGSKGNSPEQRPTPVVKKEYKGREYIRERITEWNSCRLVAITKNGGDVAVAGKNSCAVCGACPNKLWEALKEIHDQGHRITDVCLTDKGKWVVLFGKNGYRSNGLPEDMVNKLSRFHTDKETLLSATVNDNGEWVVISNKHFSAYPTEINNRLKEIMYKYGNICSVSITDDAGVAIFDRGYYWWGNYPKDLPESIKKSDFNPSTIRMAGDSWFYADETGSRYWYLM